MTDAGLGREVVTQDQALNSTTHSATVDLDVPAGKVVISSGVSTDGLGNAFMSASGPHPTDESKWRFQVSINQQSGGYGYSMTCHCWMVVLNAAS